MNLLFIFVSFAPLPIGLFDVRRCEHWPTV